MVNTATITGVVGAITGTVALFISIKAYLRVGAMKSLDLRLELGKVFDNLDIVLSGVEDYLDYVQQSHHRVLAGTGLFNSGQRQAFDSALANDKIRLRSLLNSQPQRMASYGNLSPVDLERLLSSVNTHQVQIAELRNKYRQVFEGDKDRRKEIRSHYPK